MRKRYDTVYIAEKGIIRINICTNVQLNIFMLKIAIKFVPIHVQSDTHLLLQSAAVIVFIIFLFYKTQIIEQRFTRRIKKAIKHNLLSRTLTSIG